MINISIKSHPSLYYDYLQGLELLNGIDYSDYDYPNEKVNFHIYSEFKNEKELECVKSYFATQNLNQTNLIVWSDYDISEKKELQPFKDRIDFRIYDPIFESKGTILEGRTDLLLAKDSKYYLQSDLLRLLCLHNHGGIWIDMDIILIRDFKPIMDQEFLYQWGGEIDFSDQGCCGSVMGLKKNSDLSNRLLNKIIQMPVIGSTTTWGKDLFAKVFSEQPFTVFPSTFFNTEWLMSKTNEDLSKEILDLWFENECSDDLLFLQAFAWHWHNSSNKNKKVNQNSKFDKLKKLNEIKLKNENIFNHSNL